MPIPAIPNFPAQATHDEQFRAQIISNTAQLAVASFILE